MILSPPSHRFLGPEDLHHRVGPIYEVIPDPHFSGFRGTRRQCLRYIHERNERTKRLMARNKLREEYPRGHAPRGVGAPEGEEAFT